MCASKVHEIGQSRLSNGPARIQQITHNKQVLGFLATLGPDKIDAVRIPELMNQAVMLMEIVMGDQVIDEYPNAIRLIKKAGIMDEDIAKGLLESMEADELIVKAFLKVWSNDSQ